MKKKFLSVILVIGIMASLVACGSDGTEKGKRNPETETVSAEPAANDTEKTEETEEVTEPASADDGETETSYSADDYEEQKDIFMVKHIDTGDGTEIDFTNQEIVDGPFTLGESIDIYSFFFTYAGYTKPNIRVEYVGKVDEWLVVPFAKSSFLVKEEDFNRVATLKNKANTDYAENDNEAGGETASEPDVVQSSSANTGNKTVPAPEAAPQEAAPTPAPEPETIYSEAEVISIVETALRNAGFRKPEEDMTAEELAMFGPTDGMGWGIDDIPMNDPYTAASQIVEGFNFGGWKYYYIESQGASNGYVHLKLYSG